MEIKENLCNRKRQGYYHKYKKTEGHSSKYNQVRVSCLRSFLFFCSVSTFLWFFCVSPSTSHRTFSPFIPAEALWPPQSPPREALDLPRARRNPPRSQSTVGNQWRTRSWTSPPSRSSCRIASRSEVRLASSESLSPSLAKRTRSVSLQTASSPKGMSLKLYFLLFFLYFLAVFSLECIFHLFCGICFSFSSCVYSKFTVLFLNLKK